MREVRHRQIPYDITYLQNLKKMIQMNLFTKLKQTHRLRKQIYGMRGIDWGFGIDIYTWIRGSRWP